MRSAHQQMVDLANKHFGIKEKSWGDVIKTTAKFFDDNGLDIEFTDGTVIDTKRVRVKKPRRSRRK